MPQGKAVPQDVCQAVARAYVTATADGIAAEYGLSAYTVWRIAHRLGVRKLQRVRVSPELRAQIVAARATASIGEVARQFNVSGRTVYRVVRGKR